MGLSLRCAVLVVSVLLVAACPSSHEPDPEDPRPPCPEGEFEHGNDCTEQADCEAGTCGRLGGICVEYRWTCGQCDVCFFDTVEHVENSFLPCNLETGLCEE